MAGNDATIIILIMGLCCCFCVMMGLGGFYTCTGGTFDTTLYDSTKCLTIPKSADDDDDDDDDDEEDEEYNPYGGGNMGGDTWDSENPPDLQGGADYLDCVGVIFPDETRTCFDPSNESAGIRWQFQDTIQATECGQLISKWRIDVSSSLHYHGRVYSYETEQVSTRSFGFVNATPGYVNGSFVRFRINALDFDGNLVTPSVNIEIDSSSSIATCGEVGIGNPVEFSSLEMSFSGDVDSTDFPPLNCTAGEWEPTGECMVDGEAVDPATCGPSCMQTYTRTILTPAAYGGTCITEYSEAVQRDSCNPTVNDEAIDCVVGEWFDSTNCTKTCGGGTKTQQRPVTTDDENGGNPCPRLIQQVSCNTQPCPVNCVGSWSEPKCRVTKEGGGMISGTAQFYQTYTVNQAKAHGGQDCPQSDGDEHIIGSLSRRALSSCNYISVNDVNGTIKDY